MSKPGDAETLEQEMRSILRTETTGTASQPDYMVSAYAVPTVDDFGTPSTPHYPTTIQWQYGNEELLARIVGLETELAKLKEQVAELTRAESDTVEAWTLTREQFIALAESIHTILSKKPKAKRSRKTTHQ